MLAKIQICLSFSFCPFLISLGTQCYKVGLVSGELTLQKGTISHVYKEALTEHLISPDCQLACYQFTENSTHSAELLWHEAMLEARHTKMTDACFLPQRSLLCDGQDSESDAEVTQQQQQQGGLTGKFYYKLIEPLTWDRSECVVIFYVDLRQWNLLFFLDTAFWSWIHTPSTPPSGHAHFSVFCACTEWGSILGHFHHHKKETQHP